MRNSKSCIVLGVHVYSVFLYFYSASALQGKILMG